jgi:hypothetical protein
MHSVWYRFGLLAATVYILAGCASSDPHKAPKHPEEFTVPPSEDARYSQPPTFPKDAMNQDRNPLAVYDGNPLKGSKGGAGVGRSGGPSPSGGPGGY